MNIFSKKYSTLVLIPLVLAIFSLAWSFPAAGSIITIMLLAGSFLLVSFVIVQKQRSLYRQGMTTRGVFLRNVFVEITGTGLGMVLAGLLGRYIADFVTPSIQHDLAKFMAGIAIGLLSGILMGMLVSRTWGRLVRLAPVDLPG
jgi:hypothetical protein